MSNREVLSNHGDFLGEEKIERLTIVRRDIIKESIVINGDGVVIYGDLFGENITIDLNGIVIINGNVGVYDRLVVKSGEGGLMIINGVIHPGMFINIKNTIVLGGVIGTNIVAEKTIVYGVLAASSQAGNGLSSIKAVDTIATLYSSLGKLSLKNTLTLLPIIYGGESIEVDGNIYVAGKNCVLELETIFEQIRNGISKIKSINNPLEAIDMFARSLDPVYRDINKIIKRVMDCSILELTGDHIELKRGTVPLYLSCFSGNLREEIGDVINIVEKLLIKINTSINLRDTLV